MIPAIRQALLRLLAVVVSFSLVTWPVAMERAGAGGMAHASHSTHHDSGSPETPRHRTHGNCCDLCLVACTGWTVRANVPSFERLGDTIRYEPAQPPRLTPIAWSAGPDLPLPLGPPRLSA